MGCTLLAGIAMAVYYLYITLSPFIYQGEFHVSSTTFGWLMTLAAIGSIMSKLLSPWMIVYYKQQQSLLIGIFILIISGTLLLSLNLFHLLTIPSSIISVFIAMFSIVIIGSNVMSFALSPFHEKRGAASALYGSFQLLLPFAITTTIIYLPHPGTEALAYSFFTFGIIALVIYLCFLKKTLNT